jgi:hypothetical protein
MHIVSKNRKKAKQAPLCNMQEKKTTDLKNIFFKLPYQTSYLFVHPVIGAVKKTKNP